MCRRFHKLSFFWIFLQLIGTVSPGQCQIVSRWITHNKTSAVSSVGIGIPVLTLPSVDAAALLAEDEREKMLGRPFRFGVNQPVNVNVMRDGGRLSAPGQTLYRYRIVAPGAYSVNLLFDQFKLAPGAEISLYNADSTFLVGPIVSTQNPANNQCWTDLIPGNTVILELREPLKTPTPSVIHLRGVVHGYKNTFPSENKNFGAAGSCEKNVVCYPTYQTEADGVAMILLANGTRWCTGTLMNTVNQQFRSLFLTAFHCLDDNSNGIMEAGERNAVQNWLFRFGYQSANCSPSAEDFNFVTMSGADFRAGRDVSDFALMELRQQVPPSVNPSYVGWDRSETLPHSMAGVHHPMGDVKKISFATGTAKLTDFIIPTGTTHFQVQWGDLGVTEPGSSGSPILNANRRVVGQLHGGPSECGASLSNRYDLYGRLATSWNGGSTYDTRLRDWLDPTNLVTTIGSAKATVSGPAILTGNSPFQLNAGVSNGVSWTVTAPAGVVASQIVSPVTGTGTTANLSALSAANNLTITFGISAGQPYPIRFSQVFNVTAPTTSTAQSASTTPAPLALSTPGYNCQTRELTLQATGNATIPVEFMVPGVRRWETNPVVQLPDALIADTKSSVIMIYSRQFNGVDPPTVNGRAFNFRAACPNGR